MGVDRNSLESQRYNARPRAVDMLRVEDVFATALDHPLDYTSLLPDWVRQGFESGVLVPVFHTSPELESGIVVADDAGPAWASRSDVLVRNQEGEIASLNESTFASLYELAQAPTGGSEESER